MAALPDAGDTCRRPLPACAPTDSPGMRCVAGGAHAMRANPISQGARRDSAVAATTTVADA